MTLNNTLVFLLETPEGLSNLKKKSVFETLGLETTLHVIDESNVSS